MRLVSFGWGAKSGEPWPAMALKSRLALLDPQKYYSQAVPLGTTLMFVVSFLTLGEK
jgi:hypothetical protein